METELFLTELRQLLRAFWSSAGNDADMGLTVIKNRVEHELEFRDRKIRRLETAAARVGNISSSSSSHTSAATDRAPLSRTATQRTMFRVDDASAAAESMDGNNNNTSSVLGSQQQQQQPSPSSSDRDPRLRYRESEIQRKEAEVRRRESELRRKESMINRAQRKKNMEIKVLRRLTKSYRMVARVEMQDKIRQIPYFLRRASPGIVRRSSVDGVPDDSSNSSDD
jgi:hypothetical protein